MNRKLSRREFLKFGTLAAGAAALASCAPAATPTPAPKEAAPTPTPVPPPTKAQPQETLRILALNWPQTQYEQKLADETFTPATGIKVVIDQTPYTFLEQRVKQLVNAKSAEYDIYHYDSQWIGGFVAAGALERLDTPEYLNSSDAAIHFDDFFPEITYRIGKYPTTQAELVAGKWDAFKDTPIYGLPWSLNCQVLWYRKDLISTPPATWEEVREMAKSLTKGGMFGWAWEGSRLGDYISVDYCPLMWSFGGSLWDDVCWKADGHINGPQAIEALQFMSDMMLKDKTVDPASGNWTIDERLAAILQGQTAMALNWAPLFGGIADDPNSSAVVGKIGFAPSPAGKGGQFAMFGSQGSGINAYSAKKQAAWKYLQWLYSYDTAKALVDTPGAGFVSARKDLKDYAAGLSPWQRVFIESIPMVRDFWNNASYAELLDIMQRELNLGYIGVKDPEKALNDCALAHQVVYDTSPENPKKC
ncbi:MAG: ABC transporter substrate-binding protein [Anaerolineae bacterium]